LNEDKSARYHRLRRRADLLGTASAGVVLLGLVLSGGSHRLRELAAAVTQWLPGGIDDAMNVVVLTIVLVLILQLIEFPFAFYQGHLLEHHYGLSTQSTGHWLADQGKGVLLGMVLAVAGTSVVYVALRNWPDQWWWMSAAVFAAATIGLARVAPVLLLPIVLRWSIA
jgi:STE24 endopeptidase